jgi:hypothetical protein
MKIHFSKEKTNSKITITCGYDCGDAPYCDNSKKCKHIAKHRYHNFAVRLHRFFEYKLHIKLPQLICFKKEWKRLSGTKLCPYHKSRRYSCYNCKYLGYDHYHLEENCLNKIRNNTCYKNTLEPDNDWNTKCKFFEKNDWADDYKTEDN